MKTAPDLFSYLSLKDYLEDLYRFRKLKEPGFTYERWAAELGFSSRSFMKMLVSQKRRFTPDVTKVFVQSRGFSEEEIGYFSTLISYAQAETSELRNVFLDKIFEHRSRRRPVMEIQEQDRFLSHVLLPRLQVLLSFDDIDRSASGLAILLKIDIEEVEAHLKTLAELGLAKKSQDSGMWSPQESSFYVPKNFGSAILRRYHDLSLMEAMRAQDLPTETRRYRSSMLPLTKEEYASFLADFQAFLSKNLAKYDKNQLGDARLYTMNFNLFPVTDALRECSQE
jgi:uncharacterized protein (TIGR02147 family)